VWAIQKEAARLYGDGHIRDHADSPTMSMLIAERVGQFAVTDRRITAFAGSERM
jgi:hypothetical protein